jgi:AmmeMemoRadiSam system protein A
LTIMTANDADLGRVLLGIARRAIGDKLGLAAPSPRDHAALRPPGATFVTLKQAGELRGCIGSLEPRRPLGVDVRENAIAAAFSDPRFPALTAREFETTSIEVSLLTTDERVDARSEAELIAKLRPGVDGVIVQHGANRATFLPQVWATIADPRAFLGALRRKAGLPEDFWSPQLNVSRYTVTKWAELEFLLSGDS